MVSMVSIRSINHCPLGPFFVLCPLRRLRPLRRCPLVVGPFVLLSFFRSFSKVFLDKIFYFCYDLVLSPK